MAGPSLDADAAATTTIKVLCSYGGKILPRYPDGKLRYHGGETRMLSVRRSISFTELLLKLGEMCGATGSVSLRCQLPTEDLDALVSITSDEDLANLIEEYDRVAPPPSSLKIRAFLSLPKKNLFTNFFFIIIIIIIGFLIAKIINNNSSINFCHPLPPSYSGSRSGCVSSTLLKKISR